jgi:hypothetical protein
VFPKQLLWCLISAIPVPSCGEVAAAHLTRQHDVSGGVRVWVGWGVQVADLLLKVARDCLLGCRWRTCCGGR